jgi:hypothetical protein
VIVGVNTTLTAQLPAATTDAPQLFVCEKSPDAAIDETLKAAPKLLVSVTNLALPDVPTA